jgi:hypothetical protein
VTSAAPCGGPAGRTWAFLIAHSLLLGGGFSPQPESPLTNLRDPPGLMHPSPPLRLYTRAGCCLCEGLEERLRALDPSPPLELVDVDGDPALQARYGLRVPVLAVPRDPSQWHDLPPVPPRLSGDRLASWLLANGAVGGAAAFGCSAPEERPRQAPGCNAPGAP